MSNNQHNRQTDHEGEDLDTAIVIDGNIGDYLSGTNLHDVLLGMVGSGGSVGDGKVKVSANDTTAAFLGTKLVAGTNITLTENTDGGNESLTIDAAAGSGGASSGWDTVGSDAVALQAGRTDIFDANEDAKILMDGLIAVEAGIGFGIELRPDNGQVIDVTGGDGILFPDLTSDPTAVDNGQVFMRSDTDFLRLRRDGVWVNLAWLGTTGTAQITSGNTSVTVNHGAGFDPVSARGVDIWPTNNPTNDPGWYWVSNVDSTSFQINVRANPGASGAFFAWRVVPI